RRRGARRGRGGVDRRKHACREGGRGARVVQRRPRRPRQHALRGHDRHRGHGHGRRDGDGATDRARPDPGAGRGDGHAVDAPRASARPRGTSAGGSVARRLRGRPRAGTAPRRAAAGDGAQRHLARGGGRARGIAGGGDDDAGPRHRGDGATESALLSAARLAGLDYRDERRRHPLRDIRRRGERDNWMATAHDEDGRLLIAMKGAPEQVIVRCDRWLQHGAPEPLTAERRRTLLELNDQIAARGLRVLALALGEVVALDEGCYDGLVWLGRVALTVPIRPGVADAIRACRGAGIRTVLITGDHARTAAAIYHELDLRGGPLHVFDGAHVGEVGPERLQKLVRDVDVFARVSPADKYHIVRALQG